MGMKGAVERAVRVLIYACVFVLGYFIITGLTTLFGAAETGVWSSNEGPGKYEIRSGLLMQAMGSVGSCEPEAAAQTWAEGLKERSAAMQYAVMTESLKASYARQLEDTFPNWVTGVSSPWIEQYSLVSKQQADPNNYTFRIRFATATSAGPVGSYDATLSVTKDGGYWRVAKVDTDPSLDAYTGFKR
jgi:hypothetical protein